MSTPERPLSDPTYEIRVRGMLEGAWSTLCPGLLRAVEVIDGETLVTCLTVAVPDQAALRGLVNRLWDLNLTLLGLRLTGADAAKEKNHGC